MSDSFVIQPDSRIPASSPRRKVLVTGAGGNIGRYFAENSRDRYDLTLMIHHEKDRAELAPFGRVVLCELTDLEPLRRNFEGQDTIMHLAGNPSPSATWESLLQANIVGTYNVFVAALAAKCRRVVYASSIHAVSGYPPDRQVQADDPVNPGDVYGVTKCFGEAMGRYLSEQRGLSVIAIRIGAFQPLEQARKPDSVSMMDIFISERDMNQLLEKSIDNEDLQFAILHGLSNNLFNRMNIAETRELVGYQPQDDMTAENPRLRELHLRQSVDRANESGGREEPGIREEMKILK